MKANVIFLKIGFFFSMGNMALTASELLPLEPSTIPIITDSWILPPF